MLICELDSTDALQACADMELPMERLHSNHEQATAKELLVRLRLCST